MDDAFFQEFKIEADDLLKEAEEALLEIDQGQNFQENFNAVFRSLHSVKGGAGMLGLTELQKHVHKLEEIFEKNNSESCFSKDLINFFLEGLDATKDLLEGKEVDFNYSLKSQNNNVKEVRPSSGHLASKLLGNKVKLGTVYVVDDEVDICEIIAELLESDGFQVRTFTKGTELLKSLESETPDMVIVDLVMPEMNGIDLMQARRKQDGLLPVMLLSGNMTLDACIKAMGQGVNAVVNKPFAAEDLISLVKKAVHYHRSYKLMLKSINLIAFQFENMNEYLKLSGKESDRKLFLQELKNILKVKEELSKLENYNRN